MTCENLYCNAVWLIVWCRVAEYVMPCGWFALLLWLKFELNMCPLLLNGLYMSWYFTYMLRYYIFLCYFYVGITRGFFLPGRVWVWDKMYTHVRVRVRVMGKILGHGCGFGYTLPTPYGGGCHRYSGYFLTNIEGSLGEADRSVWYLE
jgi:hypothetical protein